MAKRRKMMLTLATRPIRRAGAITALSIGILIGNAICGASLASAADFPDRPVRIVVGFTAGGPTDVPIRFIADRLSKSIGQPVVVENKPGAGSMLAIQDVLSKERDGYTLLACTYFDPVNTLLYKQAHYKVSDIAPVTLISRYDYAIAVSKKLPAKNFKELEDYAKANPNKLNYGHLGIGSSQNLVAKKLEKVAGMKMTGIPYKGAADGLREVVAGRLDFFVGPPFVVMPLATADRVNVLAVTGKDRLSSAPNIPTLTQSGIPIVAYAWLGICAGSGTPKPVIDYLNSKLEPILKSDDYKAFITKSGSTPAYSTPQEMQTVIDDTVKDAAPLVKEFNLVLD